MKIILKIMTLVLLMFLLTGWLVRPIPLSENGVVILKDWNFDRQGPVSLDGEWHFYWKTDVPESLSTHQHSFIDVPATWDSKKSFPSSGYGLYHIHIRGLEVGKNYGLKIPYMSSSYRLWIDDQLMITNGSPGKTKQTTKPLYKPQEVYFDAHSSTVDLYMNIANFHYRSGGMWSSLELGTAEQIKALTKRNLTFEALLIGSLFLSGLYHIALHFHRKKEKILLMFGITCLVIGARTLVIGEQIITILFGKLPWELIVKTEYLTFYTVVPLFAWFLYKLYEDEISKKYCQILTVISFLFSLLVLWTPAIVYTKSLFLFQTITIITIVYLIFALILAAVRNREGAKVVLIYAAFYALTIMNDILYINGVIDSIYLSSLGQFIFIFSQSYIIAKSTSNAFQKVEEYSNQLAELNQSLEEKIYERTKSLELSKLELQHVNEVLKELSYHDQLTKLPNRRYFDDLYEKEWEKALVNQTMISVLYLDIDHFKFYNDAYGHQQGDWTLQTVAACLQKLIQKFGGTVARIGGEEFIALLTDKTSEQTNVIAEECRNEVKKLQIEHKDSKISPFVTISIGVASTIPNEDFSKRKLIRMADEALYNAKEEGRNQVVLSATL